MEESDGDILFVGEGDFSFSVAFAKKFNGQDHVQITSSSYLRQQELFTTHKGAQSNVEIIKNLGVKVLHKVDATSLHLDHNFEDKKFDRIIFNFPHSGGKSNIKKNRQLLRDFFASAVHVMKERGEILLSLCRGQGGTPIDQPVRAWHDSWQAVAAAAEVDLLLHRVEPFDPRDWQEYDCTGFRGIDRNFFTGGAFTYFFVKSNPIEVKDNPGIEALAQREAEGQTVLVNQYIASKFERNLMQHGPLSHIVQELDKTVINIFQGKSVNNCGYIEGKVIRKFHARNKEKVENQGDSDITDMNFHDHDANCKRISEVAAGEKDGNCLHSNLLRKTCDDIIATPTILDIQRGRSDNIDFCYIAQKVTSDNCGCPSRIPVNISQTDKASDDVPGIEEFESVLRTTLLDCESIFDRVKDHNVVSAYGDVYRRSWISEDLPVQHEFVLILSSTRNEEHSIQETQEKICDILKVVLPNASVCVSDDRNIPVWYSQHLQEVKCIEVGYKSENLFHTLACNQVKSKGPPTVHKEGVKSTKLSKVIGYMGTTKAKNLVSSNESVLLENVIVVIFILDTMAQVKFDIPDQRLLWSENVECANQFEQYGEHTTKANLMYKPVSYYPPLWRHDLSFWERKDEDFDEQRFIDIVRNVAGDSILEVILMNVWKDPDSGRISKCYREVYQSQEFAVSHSKAHEFQNAVRLCVAESMGVELR